MGNALCPLLRPGRGYYTEEARHYGGRHGGFDGSDDDGPKQPTLSSSEVNRLPIEEFASPAEMRTWRVATLVAELKRARRNSPADRSVLDGPMPLEKDELVEAALFARGGESGARCNICFDDYESGDGLRVLPCGHRFHIECVDHWLRSKSLKCPLCNHDARSRWR